MRVALLTYRGNPYSGGQGVYVQALARGLRDIGHEVTVLSGPPYPELDAGIHLVRVPSLDLYSTVPPGQGALGRIRRPIDLYEYGSAMFGGFPEPLAFGVRAYRYLRAHRRDFDVVHDNQSLSYGLLAIQRDLRLPVVATVHHPIHIDRGHALAAAGSLGERLTIRRWYSFLRMQGFVARRLPRIISVSESSRYESSRAFRVPRQRLRTVYNGVDVDAFSAEEGVRRHADRVIVVNSADQPVKGLQGLNDMLEQLVGLRPVDVTVVGSPRDPAATRRELRRRGLDGHVRFLGKLERADLVRAYAEASVAVVPSLYEGFCFPAAEALACSVPVVAYDVGALPEVIGSDGECGRLVPAGDHRAMACAIAELLDDHDEALSLGMSGRRRVAGRFEWRRAAEQTVAVYEEAADEGAAVC